MYIDTESAADTDQASGHPFSGYYLPYPDSEYEGLVSTITHVAPILNWIYVDKETYEVKYGVRDIAQPHITGPFDCTRQDRRLTFEDWEGFVAVEEHPMVWSLYFDRDDNGLKGKIPKSTKALEVVLTRQERKKMKEDAKQPTVTDKEKAEQAGDHQTTYTQGAAVEKMEFETSPTQDAVQSPVKSAADLAKLKIGETGPSSISSDHIEGTVSSPTEPWGAASMWSNQEQQAISGASHLAPFTPSSSIYGDDDSAPTADRGRPEEATPRRTAYRNPYVEDEAIEASNLIPRPPAYEQEAQPLGYDTVQRPANCSELPGCNQQESSDAKVGAEEEGDQEKTETKKANGEASKQFEQALTAEAATTPVQILECEPAIAAQYDELAHNPPTTAVDTPHTFLFSIGTDSAAEDEFPHIFNKETLLDASRADQKTSPTLGLQSPHPVHDPATDAAGSALDHAETSPISDSHIEKDTLKKSEAVEEPIAAEGQASEDELKNSVEPSINASADEDDHEISAYLHVDEEAPAAPAQTPQQDEPPAITLKLDHDDLQNKIRNEPPGAALDPHEQNQDAPKTPELAHPEVHPTIENLPAWAALPDPYWDAAADTPRRFQRPRGAHSPPRGLEVRNFSRPQQVDEPVTLERGEAKPQSSPVAETLRNRSFREESAPPVTTSRDPYPVEDDPTSTDTSLVDTSFTAPSPYNPDNGAYAGDAAIEKASTTMRLGQQGTPSPEPKSNQSSITLGEPALEGTQGNDQGSAISEVHEGKGTNGVTQEPTSSTVRPKPSWRQSLTTRLKVSRESVLRRSKSSS